MSDKKNAMRILVLNANTTDFVTQTAAAEARRVASPGTEIVPATADFGAAIVATRSEHAIAEHAAVVLAARHATDCDAVVIAVSYDTGLKALREMLRRSGRRHDRGRAALGLHARRADRPDQFRQARVADLSRTGRRLRPGGRIAGKRVLENTSAYKPGDYSALDAELVGAASELIEKDGAESIILLGAVMAGVARRIEERVGVPVLDGMRCAIPQAEALVRIAARKPSTGSYAPPGERR